MKTKISLLFFLLIFLALSNCKKTIADPEVHYLQLVQNKSDVNILMVKLTENIVDSVLIPPDEEYILLDISSIGTIRGFQDCNTDDLGILSLEVDSSDSLMVNIDPNQSANWQFIILEENDLGGGEGQCLLVIDDQNIK